MMYLHEINSKFSAGSLSCTTIEHLQKLYHHHSPQLFHKNFFFSCRHFTQLKERTSSFCEQNKKTSKKPKCSSPPMQAADSLSSPKNLTKQKKRTKRVPFSFFFQLPISIFNFRFLIFSQHQTFPFNFHISSNFLIFSYF